MLKRAGSTTIGIRGRNPGDDGAGCIDLKTDKVIWERSYDFTCERLQLSIDGTTLHVPRHWTDTRTKKAYTIDAATGEPGRVYDTGDARPQHPFIVNPDGRRLFFPGACLDLQKWQAAVDRDDRFSRQSLAPPPPSSRRSKC